MSELLALAERCERSVGPDRELDVLIWLAATPGATREQRAVKSSRSLWPDYQIDETREASGALIVVPAYTGSIDAAMTLGDPAAEISISTLYGVARVEYPLNYADAPPCYTEHVGGLIAPAICAAILRARAEMVALRARAAEVAR